MNNKYMYIVITIVLFYVELYSVVTKALATRWIRLARDNIENKRRNRATVILDDLEKLLEQMGEENDWYYTGTVTVTVTVILL